MKTLKESLLDDEDELVSNDDSLIIDWLDSHIDPNDNWYTYKSFPGQDKVYKRTKDGYDLHPRIFMQLVLGNESIIPEYVNLKNGYSLTIATNSTKLIINSKYLTGFKDITIDGDNLQSIEVKGKLECGILDIYSDELKTILIPKGKVEKMKIINCPNLILPKCKLPKISNELDISEDNMKSLYSLLKIDPNIVKIKY